MAVIPINCLSKILLSLEMENKKHILVIKQTSLGDVLHATGHVRTIKQTYPDARLVLLTANSSEDIFRHSPWVDEIILVDRYGFKKNWWRKPRWAFSEMYRVWQAVRARPYDLAFDLQGLAKSVVFLYGARAREKYVKGNWPGLRGYRNRGDHAIREMDGVLESAGLTVQDSSMEFATGSEDQAAIDSLLADINPGKRPIIVMSPYSRWQSKDWPLSRYLEVCGKLPAQFLVVFTGSAERKPDIQRLLDKNGWDQKINLAGKLSLSEFAELVGRARIMLTGDSFPMHVAGAMKTPVIALFGPTNEELVGPLGKYDRVVRVAGCDMCDRSSCARRCLERLPSDQVYSALAAALENSG